METHIPDMGGRQNMIVLKSAQDKCLAVLQSVSGIVEHRHTLPILGDRLVRRRMGEITNGYPEQGGGSAAALNHAPAIGLTAGEAVAADCSGGEGTPAVTPSDDDGGDGDGDPDSDRRSRPRSKTSHPSFPPALLAFEPLSHYVGFGRSRIYQLIAAGEFPQPIKVGKSSRWVKADIDAWISNQATSQRVGG